MADTKTFWDSLSTLTFRSEADVEDRLISPLFEALGWPVKERHKQVPVEFHQGRTTGRKPEADIVFAPENPTPPKTAWVIVEAKKPTEDLSSSYNQAFSYCYMLKSGYFVSTNGIDFELWLVHPFSDPSRVFTANVSTLSSLQGYLEINLGRTPILDFYKKHAPAMYIKNGVDLDPYYRFLYSQKFNPNLIPRTLESQRNKGQTITIGNGSSAPSLTLKKYFIFGWGGRGKTSILNLILQDQVGSKVSRIPFFIDLRDLKNNSILETITEKIKIFCPTLNSTPATLEWLKNSKTILLLDNWDALSESVITQIENQLDNLRVCDMTLVAAARSNFQSPAGFEPYEVLRFTTTERDFVIGQYLDYSPESYDIQLFKRKINSVLLPLLREPVILGKFLELLSRSPFGHFIPPADLSSLMESLLEEILKSRHKQIYKKADEISAIFTFLATHEKDGFSLKNISTALSNSGLTASPSEIADESVAMGLIERRSADRYSFSHEIWATYFQSRELLANISSQKLTKFMGENNKGELLLISPFLVSRLTNEMLDLFIDHALDFDIDLYLYVINIQSKMISGSKKSFETTHDKILNDLYSGRIKFIQRYLPSSKSVLNPWKYADNKYLERDESPIVVGVKYDDSVSYYFGFAKDLGETVFIPSSDFTPSKLPHRPLKGYSRTSVNLTPNELELEFRYHPWLTRYQTSKKVLEELKNSIEKNELPPLGFIKNEAFLGLVNKLDVDLSTSQTVKTIRDVLLALRGRSIEEFQEIDIHGINEADIAYYEVLTKNPKLDAAITLAEELCREGKEGYKISDLCLPGPDLINSKIGYFSELYSNEQRIKRVQMLYDEALTTYKLYCEYYFSEFMHLFFYSECPCRYIIALDEHSEGSHSGWSYRHEPVKDWGTPTIVTIGNRTVEDFDELAEAYKNTAIQLGRNSTSFTMGSRVGAWNPNEKAVTKLVMKMLKWDIETIIRKLQE